MSESIFAPTLAVDISVCTHNDVSTTPVNFPLGLVILAQFSPDILLDLVLLFSVSFFNCIKIKDNTLKI